MTETITPEAETTEAVQILTTEAEQTIVRTIVGSSHDTLALSFAAGDRMRETGETPAVWVERVVGSLAKAEQRQADIGSLTSFAKTARMISGYSLTPAQRRAFASTAVVYRWNKASEDHAEAMARLLKGHAGKGTLTSKVLSKAIDAAMTAKADETPAPTPEPKDDDTTPPVPNDASDSLVARFDQILAEIATFARNADLKDQATADKLATLHAGVIATSRALAKVRGLSADKK